MIVKKNLRGHISNSHGHLHLSISCLEGVLTQTVFMFVITNFIMITNFFFTMIQVDLAP